MPRTKKTEITTQAEPEISKQQVIDVLEFARAVAGTYFPSLMTPDLVNSRLKDLSYNPMAPTWDSLNQALSNPKTSEDQLRSFVEYFEAVSAPVRRIISYMASQLSLDLLYTVTNAKGEKDYTSSKFISDQDKVYNFLDSFNYQAHFRNVIKQVLRNEIYVCCPRETNDGFVLQELPVQYCKITSKWGRGYLTDFNFYYFLLPGVSLDGFSDFFKQKYMELFTGPNGYKTYNPLLPPESRGSSQFVYWVSLPPEEGWVFKLDPSLTSGQAYMSSLLPEFMDQGIMRNLQKNMNMASATKILAASIPLLKDQGAKVTNALALDPKITGQFLSLVQGALSAAVKIAVAPIEGIQGISFDGNPEMYDDYLRTAVASSGQNSALFYTSKLKANAIESQLSFQSDSLMMEQQLYPQFSEFMNYWVGKIKTKYKYNFWFEGNAYYLSRQQRLDKAISLAGQGVVLPQLFSSALGFKPQDFYRMMDESKSIGFVDKLTPIIPAAQQSANGGAGRPNKTDSDLSEEGQQTKSDGGNIGRGSKEG
jgi:hypothetical protein